MPEPSLHHTVFAVDPTRIARAAEFFTELGFRFAEFELDDVALRVWLDWDRGIELVTPSTEDADNPVRQFLDAHGDGVYTLVLRVDDASAADQLARRYGSTTRFRQHRAGDGWEVDEIDTNTLGLPLTFLTTNLP